MSERSQSIDDMRGPFVRRLVEELWAGIVIRVITNFKGLPEDCRQSGDDSGLSDVWEEFKEQMQNGESIYFEAYEDTLRGFCRAEVSALSREQAALLWLWGEGFANCEDEDEGVPFGDVLEQNLEDELYGKVCTVACDEELESDAEEGEECSDDEDVPEPEQEDTPEFGHEDVPKSGHGNGFGDGYISLDDLNQMGGEHFFRVGERVTWRVQGQNFSAVISSSSGRGVILLLDAAENERRRHLRGAHLPSFNLPEDMWYAMFSELEPVKE